MKKGLKESLEVKYLVFVIMLLGIDIIWAGIASLLLEKIYGKSINFVLWNIIISVLGVSIAAVFF
jgi:hypothetical protein